MGVVGCRRCHCSTSTCHIADVDFTLRAVGTDVGDDFTEVAGDWEIGSQVLGPGLPAQSVLQVANPSAILISDYETPASGSWFISTNWRSEDPSGQARIIFNWQDSSNYQFVQFQNASALDGLFVTDGAVISFGIVTAGVGDVIFESVMYPYATGAGRIGICYDADTQRLSAGAGWDGNHGLVLINANPYFFSGSKTGIATGINPPPTYNVFSDFYVGRGSEKCPSCDTLCHRCTGDDAYDTLAVTISGLGENPDYLSESCGDCASFNASHTLNYWGLHPASAFHAFQSPACVWGKEIFDPVLCGYTRLMIMHGPLCFSGCGPGQTPFYKLAWIVSIEQMTPSGVASDQTMQLLQSWDCCDSPLTYTGPWSDASGADPCELSDGAVVIEFYPELPSCPTTTTTEPPPEDWWCVDNTESFDCVDVSCIQSAEIPDYVCGGPFPDDTCEGGCGGGTTTTTEPPTTTTTEGPRWACCADPPGQPSCVELEHDEECPEGEVDSFPDEITCINECGVTTTTTCDCADSTGPFPDPSICFLQSSFGTWINAASCQLVGQPCPCCACHPDDGWVCSGDPVVTPNPLLQGVCGTCGGLEGPCP